MSEPVPQETSSPIDFRTAYCQWTGCPEEQFERRVLAETLFFPARVLRALIRPFRPKAFFPEYLLIRQAGDKQQIQDIELDVDFYQHKYVVGSLARESFSLRVSGRQLLRLANYAFRSSRRKAASESAEKKTSATEAHANQT